MKNNSLKVLCIALGILILSIFSGCAKKEIIVKKTDHPSGPSAMREFRAAWVATVDNIDWPSKPGLTTEQQQQEAIAILDTLVALNMNAVIFQVRPQCDALYQSDIEPWSYYLTGKQGSAPAPFYDPLKFWIDQAHQRGLELHAWFNPYRAHHPKGDEITEYSVVKTKPNLVRKLETGYHWLDPSLKETQDYSFDVVMDVVRRYDVDGIHFDDYFYPYGDGSFPDDSSWAAFTAAGGTMSRADWRRSHVNNFIQHVYKTIKQEKKHVKFGLSPFGIWRPNHPPSIKGFDQYNMLYADARLWLNEGWIDYWTPQLYWPITQVPQSFPVLLGWWVDENTKQRNIWPGMFTSRHRDETGARENLNQIMITRGMVPQGPGHVHFSMKALMDTSLYVAEALKIGPYAKEALVPASPWLDNQAPEKPRVEYENDGDWLKFQWKDQIENDVFRYVVYYKMNGVWEYSILNKSDRKFDLPAYRDIVKRRKNRDGGAAEISIKRQFIDEVAVSAVDRTGNESPKTVFKIEKAESGSK